MENIENKKTGTIDFKSKKITYLDLAGCKPEEIMPEINKIKDIIKSSPQNSVLLFTDMTGMRYDSEIVNFAKEFVKNNEPYVKKSALIGIDGLKQIIFQAALKFSGRNNLKIFKTKEEALEWLIKD